MKTISVADFAKLPGLRLSSISEKSGEDYYHEVLNGAFAEALKANEKLTVVLDGTRGYPPSFLDEAFGNLVYDFTLDRVLANLEIVSTIEPHWIPYIQSKLKEWEGRRKAGKPIRKVTAVHKPWYGFEGDELVQKEWTKP